MTNTNNVATRTKVSRRANKTVATIIAATFPEYKGRKVTIIEADHFAWTYTQYLDDRTSARWLDLATFAVTLAACPSIKTPSVQHGIRFGSALVMLTRFMGQDMGIEIVIPRLDDMTARAIARDAVEATQLELAADIVRAAGGLDRGVDLVLAALDAEVKAHAKNATVDA